MTLQEEIDERSREIHTDNYSMSVNEAASMYAQGDLDVHPEFQRIFRWSLEQQSRLIESMFLGIPIPPIFVAQRLDGIWDVVDGVQRLSTLLRFMGVLRDDDGKPDAPVPLVGTEYLTQLAGVVWSDEVKKALGDRADIHALDVAQQRFFKRARLDFQIVEKQSDEQAKYDLFQRLNSGTRLSEQEARNCLAVMLDSQFSRWIDELAEYPSYDITVDISDRQEQESYDSETVLRFLAVSKGTPEELSKMGHFGEFLTKRMRDFIADEDFSRPEEQERFCAVFDYLANALGSDAFKRYDPERGHGGKFSISAFEAISSGISKNLDYWHGLDDEVRREQLAKRAAALWSDAEFAERSGGGKAANRRIPFMVSVGMRLFGPDHDPDA